MTDDERRAELRAWLDRKPQRSHDSFCTWLRMEPYCDCGYVGQWRAWFDDEVCECGHLEATHWRRPLPRDCDRCPCMSFTPAYLGEVSARTGPDVVTADEKARQAAGNGPPLRLDDPGKAPLAPKE